MSNTITNLPAELSHRLAELGRTKAKPLTLLDNAWFASQSQGNICEWTNRYQRNFLWSIHYLLNNYAYSMLCQRLNGWFWQL